MNKFIMTAEAVCFALGGAAQAATIKVSSFDITGFNSAVGYNDFVVQDFEDIGDDFGAAGELPGPLATNVGTFSALDGQGSGSTCDASGGDCRQLFLNNTTVNGQGNMVPDDGEWSLNANDTFGIVWDVVREGNSLFNRVVFAMMDAADRGATVTVSAGGESVEFKNLLSGNQQLIVIDFGSLIDSAQVRIASSKLDDSYSIDGASVGVVPLPAGGLLLLTGLGALALRRRRKAA